MFYDYFCITETPSMKSLVKSGQLLLFILISIFIIDCNITYAQVPPPPPNGGSNNGHGLGGNQGPASAPVGGGMEILIALGMLYAGKKMNLTEKRND
jgi:hypothetical protein